jgi:hypothetical protein
VERAILECCIVPQRRDYFRNGIAIDIDILSGVSISDTPRRCICLLSGLVGSIIIVQNLILFSSLLVGMELTSRRITAETKGVSSCSRQHRLLLHCHHARRDNRFSSIFMLFISL